MPAFQLFETLFGLLLPPASREHVLGDLHEKCKTPREYGLEAISVLGPVIISRIRRTTDLQVFLMEIFAVYLSFSEAAWWMGQKAFLYDYAGFARLAIPTSVTVIGLLLCNAYADPAKESSLIRPVLQSAGSVAFAWLGQAVLFDTSPQLAVPFAVMLYGSCISIVLVSTIRVLFPPIFSNRIRPVLLQEPRLLRKPVLPPPKVIVERIRQKMDEAPSPGRFKTAVAYVAVLLAVLLLATILRVVVVSR